MNEVESIGRSHPGIAEVTFSNTFFVRFGDAGSARLAARELTGFVAVGLGRLQLEAAVVSTTQGFKNFSVVQATPTSQAGKKNTVRMAGELLKTPVNNFQG